MDVSAANVIYIPLQNPLRFVSTFKSGLKKLTFAYKSLIFINDYFTDLSQINLEVHKYKSDLKVTLPFYNKITASFPLASLHKALILVLLL